MGKALFLGLVFLSALGRAQSFSYGELEGLIKKHDVKTVEALLPLIPESYRKFYLFMHDTRSAQAGNTTPQWPRVILYGPDATFVMTFTKNPATDPVYQGADTVETMQFNEQKATFEFRELVFGTEQSPVATPPEVNPTKCQACHGKDPRPNWDPYNTWAGSFGSLSRLSCDSMQAGTEEMRRYQDFLAGNRQRDRYAFLPRERPIPAECPHDVNTETTFVNAMHADANALLTEKLTALNFKRLARIVKSSPRFEKFKPFLGALALGCISNAEMESYFPAGYAAGNGLRSVEELETTTIEQARLDFGQRLQRFALYNRASQNPLRRPINFHDDKDEIGGMFSHRHSAARIRLVAERMKLNPNKWAMAFTDGDLDFTTPRIGPDEFFVALKKYLPYTSVTCEELKVESVKALGEKGAHY